jgi:hypothetical protein
VTRQIEPPKVEAVLFDTGWIEIQLGTFTLDEIEFGRIVPPNRWEPTYGPNNTGMAPVGFSFVDKQGKRVTGSMRAIRALRHG